LVLRLAGALGCLLLALLMAVLGVLLTVATGSTYCEDYGICSEANGTLAAALGLTATVATLSLVALAIALVLGAGRPRVLLASASAGASLLLWVLLVGAW